ncbi:MAG: hypothetical protein LUC30_07145 [Clostridiales bacterium]|nr:hypothetical protein [Clostridiales bacterium]
MKKRKVGISTLALLDFLLLGLGSPSLASATAQSINLLSKTYYASASASGCEPVAYRYVKAGSSAAVYKSHIYNQHAGFIAGSTYGHGNGQESGCGYCALATAYNLLGYSLNRVDLASMSYDTALDNMAYAVGTSMGYSDWSYMKLYSLKPKWIGAFFDSAGHLSYLLSRW